MVHDVPLLVEKNYAPMYHLVVIVDADIAQRIHRLVSIRGMSEEDVGRAGLRRITAGLPPEPA